MSSDQEHLRETDTEDRFDFEKAKPAAFKTGRRLTEETIRLVPENTDDPEWMLERRLRARVSDTDYCKSVPVDRRDGRAIHR
jgi:Fe-S cluster assembly protein SufB